MSKYQPLHDFLSAKSGPVEASFASLSDQVEGGLPASAFRYTAWWASDATHVQSRSWVSAGFRAEPACPAQRVRFVPN